MRVGGLDLARRSDYSALVTLDTTAGRATVTRALRLAQVAFRRQIDMIAPVLAGLDILAFDAGGVGDGVAELLPREGGSIPVLIVAGSGEPQWRRGERVSVGKAWLIGTIRMLAGSGRLIVAPDAPGGADLRSELQAFAATPTRRGVRLEARGQSHDDLVVALGLAILAAEGAQKMTQKRDVSHDLSLTH